MKKRIFKVKIFSLLFLLLISFLSLNITGCTSTIDPNTAMTRFSLKGNEKKEVNLYGQKYIFEITKIVDTRCTSNQAGFGLAGVKVNLSIKFGQTTSNKDIELYSNVFCGSRDLKDTLTFFDKVSDVEKSQKVDGFEIRLFDATPYQTGNPFKIFPLSDYELILITKKQ